MTKEELINEIWTLTDYDGTLEDACNSIAAIRATLMAEKPELVDDD